MSNIKEVIFIINDFNTKLADLINNSNLPLDVVTLCLQNNMYQIELIKLNSKIDELNQIININKNENESDLHTNSKTE